MTRFRLHIAGGVYALVSVLLCIALSGCDELMDYHPYSTNLSGEHDINANNIAVIEPLTLDKDTMRIAFISDTHDWYDDIEDEVNDINARTDIDFVVHCGDLTDAGFTKEFQWARERLEKLNVPYVALIGNHDFLGTGTDSYEWMFGPLNFSFIAGRVKFVCIDTNAMEYNFEASVPNLDFMKTEATTDTTLFDRTVVVMHVPPHALEFNQNVLDAFNYYLQYMPGLMFCVFGHNHSNENVRYYEDNVMFHGVDCADHRNYKIFTIIGEVYGEEIIYF